MKTKGKSLRLLLTLVLAVPVVLGAIPPDEASRQAPASGNRDFTLRAGGLERHYSVHVPKGYDGKKPLPVVVMLHGGGGRGQGAARETGWDAKADEAGFLAVFPDAVPSDPLKPAKFGGNPQLWNDGSGRFEAGQNGVDDVGFLRVMLSELSATFTVDSRRIYFTGFSNGAEVVFITVEGLGHTWAGGTSLLPESLVGKRTDKIRATDVLWEFFRKHALPEQARQKK